MMKLAAVGLLALATLISPNRADPGIAYVRIFGTTMGVEYVDLGPQGPSAGDELIRGLRLTDPHRRIIGSASFMCVSLGKALEGTSVCNGVYSLPRGKLVVQGTRRSMGYYVLPITGGTGVYSHASGSLIAVTVALHPRKDRLLFSLETP